MVSEGVVLHAGRVLGQERTVLGGGGLCGEQLLKWQTGRQSAQLEPEGMDFSQPGSTAFRFKVAKSQDQVFTR